MWDQADVAMSASRPVANPLQESTLALSEVFELLPDAVAVIDNRGCIAFANGVVSNILGYAPEELVGESLDRLVPVRHRARHARLVAGFSAKGRATPMTDRPVLLALHKSGEEVPVSISIANFELSGERYSVAMIRDASPVRDQLGRATARAETDALTGLGNRLAMSRCARTAIEAGRPFGLLFLDLTRFKPFNDHYGHAMGDEVLRLIARRLKAIVRANDLAVRLGGDEFVVMLDGLHDANGLENRARSVAESLSQPFHLQNTEASIGVNIGGALFPRDGRSETDLLAVADRNMYRAKRAEHAYCTEPADK